MHFRPQRDLPSGAKRLTVIDPEASESAVVQQSGAFQASHNGFNYCWVGSATRQPPLQLPPAAWTVRQKVQCRSVGLFDRVVVAERFDLGLSELTAHPESAGHHQDDSESKREPPVEVNIHAVRVMLLRFDSGNYWHLNFYSFSHANSCVSERVLCYTSGSKAFGRRMTDLLTHIASSFSRFNLSSALDILIVTALFYSVLMLIRGTRADQVLRGIIVLFIFFSLVAAEFHLTMVDWLLHNSPLVLLVALPIIFQPELRRALEQVGRTSAIINHPLATLQSPIRAAPPEIVVDAVRRLAERRYGALIVLEGTTGLEDFVRSGVRLDADVSRELLMTIFFVHSPLHDGATIIRGDRVVAASVLLPLTDNPAAAGRGTRHRAAIGITEQTDAACIIVSEETGQISLARGGHLTPNITVERLARYVQAFDRSHFGEPQLAAVES